MVRWQHFPLATIIALWAMARHFVLLAMASYYRSSKLSRSEFYFQFQKIHVVLIMVFIASIQLKPNKRQRAFIKHTFNFQQYRYCPMRDNFSLMYSFDPNYFPLNKQSTDNLDRRPRSNFSMRRLLENRSPVAHSVAMRAFIDQGVLSLKPSSTNILHDV